MSGILAFLGSSVPGSETEAVGDRAEGTATDGGEAVRIRRNILPLYDDSRDVVGALEIIRDVTERETQRRRKQQLADDQGRAIEDLQETLARLAEGDLTIDPSPPAPDASFDEIRSVHERFQKMNRDLSRATNSLERMVDQLGSQAEEVAAASAELNASVRNATSSIEAVVAEFETDADGAVE